MVRPAGRRAGGHRTDGGADRGRGDEVCIATGLKGARRDDRTRDIGVVEYANAIA